MWMVAYWMDGGIGYGMYAIFSIDCERYQIGIISAIYSEDRTGWMGYVLGQHASKGVCMYRDWMHGLLDYLSTAA
jgi:hypothetical protein